MNKEEKKVIIHATINENASYFVIAAVDYNIFIPSQLKTFVKVFMTNHHHIYIITVCGG